MSTQTTESITQVALDLWKTWVAGIVAILLAIWTFNSSIGANEFFALGFGVLALIAFGRGAWELKKSRTRFRGTGIREGATSGVERRGRRREDQGQDQDE